MDKYINLFTDFGFKKVFGEEPNKDLLISFLNTLLPAKHQIAELEYSRNEWQGVSALDRKAIFDLHCKTSDGTYFLVELQKAKQNYFKDRSLYYASLKYYRDLKNVIDTAYGDGLTEGIEQGIAKGIEQERAVAYQERLTTAKNLKDLGLSNEQIAQASSLPLSEIADL